MESLRSTEMPENFSQTTRRQIPEDTTPRNHWPENPKSNMECDTGSEALVAVVMECDAVWSIEIQLKYQVNMSQVYCLTYL